MKPRPAPIRSPDQTTFTWSLSKELKAKLLLAADAEGRPLSNYLTWVLAPQVEAALAAKGIAVDEETVEHTLAGAAERAYRGIPFSKPSK
jgi:hypothetical protein